MLTFFFFFQTNKKHNCAKKLGTLITFYTSTLANVFSRKELNNQHFTIVLPSFLKALTSDLIEFKASGYIIAGQLITSNQVTKDLLKKLIQLILDVSCLVCISKEHSSSFRFLLNNPANNLFFFFASGGKCFAARKTPTPFVDFSNSKTTSQFPP